ncbi:STAS domain-containing protein [Gordonia hirsuta]|uniref:STAS domain-containing protein n=1 Tax=Gordonia hirsuta TaxID=53427 RepID=UPI0003463F38|nr:sodium-independent anion transporter [Gordonia hirsuta]
MLILRFDGPLFFANGALFDEWVRVQVTRSASSGRPIRTVVLAAEPITRIDSSAIDELIELDDYLCQHGIDLVFAELKDPVREHLERYWLAVGDRPRFVDSQFAPTLGAIVDALREEDAALREKNTDSD